MRQSLVFIPSLRDNPKDAEINSHKLLIRGGYIRQVAAGVYSYLPAAFKVIQKIEKIVREELDSVGCSELLMPALQPKELWIESKRWEGRTKESFVLQDRHDRDFLLGPTHEEVITSLVRDYAISHKKLPLGKYDALKIQIVIDFLCDNQFWI